MQLQAFRLDLLGDDNIGDVCNFVLYCILHECVNSTDVNFHILFSPKNEFESR